MNRYRFAASVATLATALFLALPAQAQQVEMLDLDSVPPDMIESDPAGDNAAVVQPIDLGEDRPRAAAPADDGTATATALLPPRTIGTAVRAARE